MTIELKKYELNNKLKVVREEVIETIKNFSKNDLEKKVFSHKESWTIFEVIKHLNSSENGMIRLMQNILQGGEGVPEDFDLKRYNKRQVEKQVDISYEELLQNLEKNRKDLLQFMDTLEGEDFQKKGRHGSLKTMTIEEIINKIADHETDHLMKIKKIL
ncbi:MAG: DinB family protein [Promethearchaeota archaeon]